MSRWIPDSVEIALNEHMGRRLFDEPHLRGAGDQKPFAGLDIRHFEEGRDDGELSLDRVGRSSVDRRVVNYLRPRAEAAGQKFSKPKTFEGWAVIKAVKLMAEVKDIKLILIGSPIEAEEPNDNPYHAHIPLKHSTGVAAGSASTLKHVYALHIRYLVEKYGFVVDRHGKPFASSST